MSAAPIDRVERAADALVRLGDSLAGIGADDLAEAVLTAADQLREATTEARHHERASQ